MANSETDTPVGSTSPASSYHRIRRLVRNGNEGEHTTRTLLYPDKVNVFVRGTVNHATPGFALRLVRNPGRCVYEENIMPRKEREAQWNLILSRGLRELGIRSNRKHFLNLNRQVCEVASLPSKRDAAMLPREHVSSPPKSGINFRPSRLPLRVGGR